MARWTRCVSTQGNLRGVAIQATDLIQELADLHKLDQQGAQGLGEAAIAALLLGSYLKPGERVNLNIQGSGHYRQALTEAWPDGRVRGFITQRPTDQIAEEDLQSLGPWGGGIMSVLRTQDGDGKKPYIGTVPLVTGHLAKDITYYWAQSEQVPSAAGIIVEIKEGRVAAAGGFLVQVMPGATPQEIASIENHIHDLSSFSALLAGDQDPSVLLTNIFQDTSFVMLGDQPLRHECNCSWERVKRALVLVGVDELKNMLKQDHGAEVHCDFCTKVYQMDSAALEKMIKDSGALE